MLNNLYYTVETPVTVARTVSVADTVVEDQPHDPVLGGHHGGPDTKHVCLHPPVGVYCLQDPQSGALQLLPCPGGPGIAGHVGRVQGGPGVRGLVVQEVVVRLQAQSAGGQC